MVANPGMSENDAVYREVSTAMDVSAILLIPVLNSTTTCTALIQGFVANGKCYFQDEVPLGKALGKVVHRPRLGEAAEETENYDKESIGKLLDGQRGILTPGLVASVLTKAGFGLPLQAEVISRDKLALSCDNVGYPLAMKVVGPLHKSESGGERLRIQRIEAALAARDELTGIDGATAVPVQQMVEGTEVILGASRTDDLGHLVMFGLGGIYAEALRDVQFAPAPLSHEECRAMVEGIRGYPILKGIRGQKGISLETLSDYVGRLGRLVTDFPRIREIDINPLKGFGRKLFVVDARIIMD
jgi:hypothetical protein